MSRTHRQRAEACFAVARSATIDGERTAAIGRGLAICERHGLSPDSFDIPGRAARPNGAPRTMARRSYVYAGSRTDSSLADLMVRFAEALATAESAADVRAGETPYDARRRNFEEATRAAAMRDQARGSR